ncbi:MAG TPA: hypothetical protein VGB98_21380 [Pyrinomonadaceae bacterium]|jgi:hypothetical protein
MSNLKNRIVKATALGLALTVTHVCLSAEVVCAATSRLVAAAVPAQGAPQGRLTTRGNNPVTVNGNSARSGETVFSGQSVQTPAGVGATVNVPGMGRVDIAPNSNVTVSFGEGKINVTVVSGCAILTANRGTAGTLTAGGTTQQTKGTEGGVIDACASTTPGGAPVVGQGAAAAAGAGAGSAAAGAAAGGGGLFGLGTAGTVGVIAAAAGATTAAVILVPCRRGPNPSPGTPRGRNDECR